MPIETSPPTAAGSTARQPGAAAPPTGRRTPAAVALREVTKSFSGSRTGERVQAVRGITTDIAPGEVVALLGPNGAGKTTTLDMILGLTTPTSGTVTVHGQSPREAIRHGRISAVLQTGGLLRDLTIAETLRLVASTYTDPRPIDDVIEQTGLGPLRSRKVSKCSGGEQQRLRYALALLPDPDLLVLDEPTAGMDVAARRDFWASMHADASRGRTVLFATHYLDEADAFADRIIMVAHGEIVADGTTEEIRARASGRTVSAVVPDIAAATAHLRRLGAASVTTRGDRLVAVGDDSDALARALLVDLDGTDLEVTTASLDSAFLAITGTETSADPGRDTTAHDTAALHTTAHEAAATPATTTSSTTTSSTTTPTTTTPAQEQQ